MKKLSDVSLQDLWYLAGFIATDGNLSKDGRHINITTNDVEPLEKIRKALGLTAKISFKRSGYTGRLGTQLQFGSVELYRWLSQIGLTPAKTLTLGSVKVPDTFFPDFFRGVVDGDGSIRRWYHSQNGNEQWALTVVSAAPKFAQWLFDRSQAYFGVAGILISSSHNERKNPLFVIKFGKMAARQILEKSYYPGALVLERKYALAKQCIDSYRGWSKSVTVRT